MSEPVFVITPIGGADTPARRRADDLFDLVIRPVIAAVNAGGPHGHDLVPVRADMIERPGSITDGIVEHILGSKVVIVDLAGANPNVYYEMGIADSFGIPTVRLSDDPGSLPFDAKDHNAIELVSTADGSLLGRDIEACKVALKGQLTHALADDFTPTSIVIRRAKVARLDSLTTSLDTGDRQDKALAAVLEKLSTMENRFDQLTASDGPTQARSRVVGAPPRVSVGALALLRVLLDRARDHAPPVSRKALERAARDIPELGEAADVLFLNDLLGWAHFEDTAPVLDLQQSDRRLRTMIEAQGLGTTAPTAQVFAAALSDAVADGPE